MLGGPAPFLAPPLSLSQPEGPLPAVSLRSTETSLLDVEETESASSDEALHSVVSGFFSALIDRLRGIRDGWTDSRWPPAPCPCITPLAQANQAVHAPAVPST